MATDFAVFLRRFLTALTRSDQHFRQPTRIVVSSGWSISRVCGADGTDRPADNSQRD